MRTNLGLDERTTGTPAPRRTVSELKRVRVGEAQRRASKSSAPPRAPSPSSNMWPARATPVDVFDIIATLKLPKATAYRLVDWFVTQGYLAREPGRRRLIIGPKLTNLAFGALSSSMRNDTPHVVLQRLVHTLNETCNIGTLLNGEVVYLDRVEAEHWPLRLHYTTGSRVPLHCSAIGKLLSGAGRLAAPPPPAAEPGAAPLHRQHASPTAHGSRPSCGRSARSRCHSIARNISSVSSAWRCR